MEDVRDGKQVFDRASRQKMFMFPVNETHLGRVCFSVVTNARVNTRRYLLGTSAKKNKDVLEIILDDLFETTLVTSLNYFSKYSDLITEDEFLDGYLLLRDWNKDLTYPTVYDVVLDTVEQWQQYHYNIRPGPSKDAWLALLAEKIKWPKDRLQDKPFLRNNKRLWYPFMSNEDLNEFFSVKEQFLQVGSLQLPERIFFDQIDGYESHFEHKSGKREDKTDKTSRYLRYVGKRTLRAWKEMAKTAP